MIIEQNVRLANLLNKILPNANLPAGVEPVAGSNVQLAEFTTEERNALIEILDAFFPENASPVVKNMVAENATLIVDLIRAVKSNTKQQFSGVSAKGNELTIKPLDVDDFTFVWGSDVDKTFEHEVTKDTIYDYIGTSASPETTEEENGVIILGFIEETPKGKIGRVQLKKNGDDYPQQILDWDAITAENVVPLPRPYVILPESTYQIKVMASETGTVIFKPIGFKVLQAKAIKSLFQ